MIKISLIILICFMVCFSTSAGSAQELTAEGKQAKASHDYLFETLISAHLPKLEGKKTDPYGRKLRSIELKKTRFEINGEANLLLPEGTENVAQFFRYFELRGKNLHQLEGIYLLPVAPDSQLNISTKTPNVYRVKVPSLPTPNAKTPRFRLSVKGKAIVESIHLVTFGSGLFEKFDHLPFVNLGHDQPVKEVAVNLDVESLLSIEGHVELDRTKWFRYYGKPGSLPLELEKYALEKNFTPGRQIFKFEPALVKGYSPKSPKLKEDSKNPGFADPNFFESKYQSDYFAKVKEIYPKDYRFAMCFNDYPEFMSVKHTGRGTPLKDKFPAAADLVAKYLKNQIKHSGRTATWWELKNESRIKAEWDYHWTKEDSWKLMADFHNTVADKVHEQVPNVKIGGPSSAWMQVQVGDFSLWKNQARFMDLTKGHLDFYSHHFYENAGTIGAFARRDQGYTNYLTGRLESILDMFKAHMHAIDNVRPMLLTEFGALNIGKSEADYWLRIRSFNAYLARLMDRPDQFEMVVPFIFLSSPWDPTNGSAILVPNENGGDRMKLSSYRKTPCHYVFELWKDFDGSRIPIESGNRYLKAIAVLNGNRIQIALSNMSGNRIAANLNSILKSEDIKSAEYRRLYRLDGKIRYEESTDVSENLDAVPVEVGETSVLTIKLNGNQAPPKTKVLTRHYAKQTAIPVTSQTKDGLEINFPEDIKSVKTVKLFVGVHRRGGLNRPITGTFNGVNFECDTSWAKGVSDVFEQAIVEIPASKLKAMNKIVVSNSEDGLTLTEVHIEAIQIK